MAESWSTKAGWQDRFIAALAKTLVVAKACKVAGVTRRLAYETRKKDEDFRRRWNDVIQAGVDEVEASAFYQARTGDYRFASMILRTYRPMYRKALQTVQHTGADGGPLRIEFVRPEAYDYGNTIDALVRDSITGAAAGSEGDSDADGEGHTLSVCGDGTPVGEVNDGG